MVVVVVVVEVAEKDENGRKRTGSEAAPHSSLLGTKLTLDIPVSARSCLSLSHFCTLPQIDFGESRRAAPSRDWHWLRIFIRFSRLVSFFSPLFSPLYPLTCTLSFMIRPGGIVHLVLYRESVNKHVLGMVYKYL